MSELVSEQLSELSKDVLNCIRFDKGGVIFTSFIPLKSWTVVEPAFEYSAKFGGDIRYKIKVENPTVRVFAKVFSPAAEAYARTAYKTLLELADLQTSIPILRPMGFKQGIIFFDLGVPVDRGGLAKWLSDQEINSVDGVVRQNNLIPIRPPTKADVVEIAGSKYIVDPFDDDSSWIDYWINKYLSPNTKY